MTHNPEPWKTSAAFDENDVFIDDNWNDPFINLFREAFAPAEYTDDPIRVEMRGDNGRRPA